MLGELLFGRCLHLASMGWDELLRLMASSGLEHCGGCSSMVTLEVTLAQRIVHLSMVEST